MDRHLLEVKSKWLILGLVKCSMVPKKCTRCVVCWCFHMFGHVCIHVCICIFGSKIPRMTYIYMYGFAVSVAPLHRMNGSWFSKMVSSKCTRCFLYWCSNMSGHTPWDWNNWFVVAHAWNDWFVVGYSVAYFKSIHLNISLWYIARD